jgi:mRNA-degrading endonuclease toxin of MazEF toxin-antitoxin module
MVNFSDNPKRTPETGLKTARYVLVVEDDDLLENDEFESVIVAPFTTKEESTVKGRYDMPIPCGEGNLTADCYCCLAEIQSIGKCYIKPNSCSQEIGHFEANRMEQIKVQLTDILGLGNYC